MDDLYQQQIIDLYHNPKNFGELKNPDLIIHEANASCGDDFTFFIKLNSDKSKIKKITFTGSGCAISTAASSLLTQQHSNKPLPNKDQLTLEHMQNLIGVEVTLLRQKCLMLPAKAIGKIGQNNK